MDAVQSKEVDAYQSPVALGLLGGIGALALVGSFWPSIAGLVAQWRGDDNYGHGWFVAPIALAILWNRRDRLESIRSARASLFNFLPLAALLGLRYVLFERNEAWIEAALFPVVVAAFVFAVGGRPLLGWSWPAILFLFFMLPLPPSLNPLLAGQLQTIATIGSVNLLHALGLPVINEGNVILVGDQRLEVAEACRGLSMLLSFATLITAMVILVKRPIWERVALMASIIPIALACNIIRIAVTAFCYAKFGGEVKIVHDWAGLAMMPLALGIVLLEMKVLSWLIVEVDMEQSPRAFIRASYGDSPGPRS